VDFIPARETCVCVVSGIPVGSDNDTDSDGGTRHIREGHEIGNDCETHPCWNLPPFPLIR